MGKHDGKVALCVGSATGIGAASILRLSAGGARIVLGDIIMRAAEALIEQVIAAGGEGIAVECDIASETAVAALVQAGVARFGGIDLVHLNAADLRVALQDNDLLTADLAVFDQTIAVNLRGHLICTRAVIPELQKRGGGAIVYTSSDAVYTMGQGLCFYRLAKGGLNSLMRQVAVRWGKEGIRANVVSPGMVMTDANQQVTGDSYQAVHLERTPSPRLGAADDIAAMVDFLLSPDAAWVNGQTVSVNGGFLMRP
jgi:NAD(P)-dependent dehydrogenase (short-subunit alcohol dehydrogenase family)